METSSFVAKEIRFVIHCEWGWYETIKIICGKKMENHLVGVEPLHQAKGREKNRHLRQADMDEEWWDLMLGLVGFLSSAIED